MFPVKPRLAGEVSEAHVKLYRSRAATPMYLWFEGRWSQDGNGTALTGRFVNTASLYVSFCIGFMFVWGLLAFLAPLVNWRGPAGLAWSAAGVGAMALAVVVLRFRRRNRTIEQEFLARSIEEALGHDGA